MVYTADSIFPKNKMQRYDFLDSSLMGLKVRTPISYASEARAALIYIVIENLFYSFSGLLLGFD